MLLYNSYKTISLCLADVLLVSGRSAIRSDLKNLGFSLEGSGSLLVLNVGNGACWQMSHYYAGRLVINSFLDHFPIPYVLHRSGRTGTAASGCGFGSSCSVNPGFTSTPGYS